jgi:hypothetical protein
VVPDAGAHIEHLQLGLKGSLSDPKIEVRRAALECVAYLLNYMGPKYLKQSEPTLVSYMLIGLNDQNLDNVLRCRSLLEEVGQSIRSLEEGELKEEGKE